MTVILRLKFTGLPNMEKVMEYVENNLKIIINEVMEENLNNDTNRWTLPSYVGSSEWEKGKSKDMLSFTIRWNEKFYTTFDGYKDFPFDKCKFTLTFELAQFHLDEN